MDNILRDFQSHTVSYVDDILVFSQTTEEHEQHLNKILAAIKLANLNVNLEKCQMRVSEIHFLGFTINKSGVLPI